MTRPSPEVVDAARASAKQYGIPASVTLAQWALESAWGKRMPPGSNNPFGIKALAGQPYVVVPTHEVVKGQRILVSAAFRKFDSLADAFEAHAKLLATAPVYAHARAMLPDPYRFADALTGTYATDPHYGDELGAIIRGDDFERYDA